MRRSSCVVALLWRCLGWILWHRIPSTVASGEAGEPLHVSSGAEKPTARTLSAAPWSCSDHWEGSQKHEHSCAGKGTGSTALNTEASLPQGQKGVIQRFCNFPSTNNSTFVQHLTSPKLWSLSLSTLRFWGNVHEVSPYLQFCRKLFKLCCCCLLIFLMPSHIGNTWK